MRRGRLGESSQYNISASISHVLCQLLFLIHYYLKAGFVDGMVLSYFLIFSLNISLRRSCENDVFL